ncbi:phosphatidylinositol N-acetylglucosaminyltransferase subunit C [Condylostylus longicornis]|uniref:phosphatidylinositol N-acetylglucosaminyltransferase subunit C n=1 Tax=Condylostylus longicornis TaxID=2530218 RepID=UPI00244DCE02|nr:phosphatidylinositol N-acetylglucosaminyltransferase subunit C [Condylostylus longicornis]
MDNSIESSKIKKKPWKKNLYENKDYDDNYTHEPTFLKDLERNKNIQIFTLSESIKGATLLNNQISCITAFLIVFYLLYDNILQPTFVLAISGISTFIGYSIFIGGSYKLLNLSDDLKTVITVLFFGYIFSPLLYRLTDSVSTDTIFSLTFFVFFLNLIFFNYGLPAAIVSKPISINSAIFGSICLASRLSSSHHAFVLLVVSVQFFVLYPMFTEKFWKSYFIIPIICCCSLILFIYSLSILMTYLFVMIFINFFCPWLFVRLQKYKNNIHGP